MTRPAVATTNPKDTVGPDAWTHKQPVKEFCLSADSTRLGGVSLYGHRADLLGTLGRPIMETHDSAEDDGGVYEFSRLRFTTIVAEVDPRFDQIQLLTTTDPKVELGPGVHTGMDESTVRSRLRLEGPTSAVAVVVPICSREDDAPDEFAKLTLRFNHRVSPGVLVGEELSQYGP